MAATAVLLPAAAAAAVLLLCLAGGSRATNVTYDHRALVIDGVRRVLVSGSIHYPRSTPDVSTHHFVSISSLTEHALLRCSWLLMTIDTGTPPALVLADVAGADPEGQGRRPGRHRDLRLLGHPRARPGTGTYKHYTSHSPSDAAVILQYLYRFCFLFHLS
jgi:hypothetical protein